MIEAASIGAAMDNAPASVKACADVVAPCNVDDGVAYALAALLDMKEVSRRHQGLIACPMFYFQESTYPYYVVSSDSYAFLHVVAHRYPYTQSIFLQFHFYTET